MNREIKFRGKDLKTGKWVYGDLLQYNEGGVAIGIHGTFIDDGYHFNEYWDRCVDVEEDSVGQFTCLHDCNDKEIYEGDYIEACFKYEDITPSGCVIPDQDCIVHGIVEWNDCGFCIKIKDCEYPLKRDFMDGDIEYLPFSAFQSPEDDIEVKSNIHDNPKLLEK